MNFWNFYLYGFFPAYLVLVPFIIFIAKPEMPSWKKSGRILLLVFLLPFLMMTRDYVRAHAGISKGPDYGCWIYDLYFFLLSSGLSVIYTGWWEYGWRQYHKQIFWKIKDNFQYGIVSNAIVFLSAVGTLYFTVVPMICSDCGKVFFVLREFAYFKIVPLFC